MDLNKKNESQILLWERNQSQKYKCFVIAFI